MYIYDKYRYTLQTFFQQVNCTAVEAKDQRDTSLT